MIQTMICFLCGAEYDNTNRTPVAVVKTEDDIKTDISFIRGGNGKVLRLCPSCTRAAVFGNMMNGGDLTWCGEVGYEEE